MFEKHLVIAQLEVNTIAEIKRLRELKRYADE